MKQDVKYTYSWTIVIIALILFWPVGIFFLIMKLANDRSASFGVGRLLIKVVAGFLLFFAVMMLWYGIDTGEMGVGIFLVLLFGIPGLWLWRKAKQMKRDANKTRTYIDYIVNQQVRDIDVLARKLGVSQQVVLQDVSSLINRGMLGQARLNQQSNTIQFPEHRRPAPQPQPRPQAQQHTYQQRAPQQRAPQQPVVTFEPRTIRCSACSANNFVESLPARCEYCGSSLHQ